MQETSRVRSGGLGLMSSQFFRRPQPSAGPGPAPYPSVEPAAQPSAAALQAADADAHEPSVLDGAWDVFQEDHTTRHRETEDAWFDAPAVSAPPLRRCGERQIGQPASLTRIYINTGGSQVRIEDLRSETSHANAWRLPPDVHVMPMIPVAPPPLPQAPPSRPGSPVANRQDLSRKRLLECLDHATELALQSASLFETIEQQDAYGQKLQRQLDAALLQNKRLRTDNGHLLRANASLTEQLAEARSAVPALEEARQDAPPAPTATRARITAQLARLRQAADTLGPR